LLMEMMILMMIRRGGGSAAVDGACSTQCSRIALRSVWHSPGVPSFLPWQPNTQPRCSRKHKHCCPLPPFNTTQQTTATLQRPHAATPVSCELQRSDGCFQRVHLSVSDAQCSPHRLHLTRQRQSPTSTTTTTSSIC
jgi:hypothetical protein